MLNDLEATIQQIIVNASADIEKDIATAVRQALAAEIMGNSAHTPRVPKMGEAVHLVFGRGAGKTKNLSEAQVANNDAAILEVVRTQAALRLQEVAERTGIPWQDVAPGLKRLRDAGKIKMKGTKRGAKYSAA